MKKGELWYADLNPSKGSEQSGHRPVLIVSGNLVNKYAPVILICPLTTKIKTYKGDVILEPTADNGLLETSEVLSMHLRSVSRDRLDKCIGKINPEELSTIRKSLQDLLTLD
jgi:mRNA interferase MazF